MIFVRPSNAAWARKRPRRDPGPRGRQGGRRNADPGDEPLYTLADAQAALRLLERVSYGERHAVAPGVAFTFRDAGHILGSAIVELELGEGAHARRIVFSTSSRRCSRRPFRAAT